jgi:hypothetical protein
VDLFIINTSYNPLDEFVISTDNYLLESAIALLEETIASTETSGIQSILVGTKSTEKLSRSRFMKIFTNVSFATGNEQETRQHTPANDGRRSRE